MLDKNCENQKYRKFNSSGEKDEVLVDTNNNGNFSLPKEKMIELFYQNGKKTKKTKMYPSLIF